MKDWVHQLPLAESLTLLSSLAKPHIELAGPHSPALLSLLESRDWKSLIEYEPLNVVDQTVEHLQHARQAIGFFQKLEPLEIGVDKEEVAFKKFLAAEQKCADTNQLFRSAKGGHAVPLLRVPEQLLQVGYNQATCAYKLCQLVQRKIARVLGPCPQIEDLHMTFGPGATTSTKMKDSCPTNKMARGFSCSTDLYASGLLPSVLREFPHWLNAFAGPEYLTDDDCDACIVPVALEPGGLQFVPKNAKTYRTIIVEPVLNTLVQSGLQRCIARRLLYAGVSIKDQTVNQRFAQRGSIDNDVATLDLSSASDLIARNLVGFLLPNDWFELLNAARTSTVQYRGKEFRLQKFCSMGNGFTFPLETLIFWAITLCASQLLLGPSAAARVNAYGDDIICPKEAADFVMECLQFFGFEVNTEKSYTEGPFRESCGKDYFYGIDVRPYYQKDLVSAETLFTLHNFYYRKYGPGNLFLSSVKEKIPRHLRLYGPDGYGDGHLLSPNYPTYRRPSEIRKGYGGVRFDTYSRKRIKVPTRFPGDWVSPLYCIYTSAGEELLPGVRETSATEFLKDGRPVWTVPGSSGYRRTSIYTISL